MKLLNIKVWLVFTPWFAWLNKLIFQGPCIVGKPDLANPGRKGWGIDTSLLETGFFRVVNRLAIHNHITVVCVCIHLQTEEANCTKSIYCGKKAVKSMVEILVQAINTN